VRIAALTNVELVSAVHQSTACLESLKDIPIIINSLDNETKGWADTVDIFIHNPLDYGGLSSIVQAAARQISK
jgi:hypothetical protein